VALLAGATRLLEWREGRLHRLGKSVLLARILTKTGLALALVAFAGLAAALAAVLLLPSDH